MPNEVDTSGSDKKRESVIDGLIGVRPRANCIRYTGRAASDAGGVPSMAGLPFSVGLVALEQLGFGDTFDCVLDSRQATVGECPESKRAGFAALVWFSGCFQFGYARFAELNEDCA